MGIAVSAIDTKVRLADAPSISRPRHIANLMLRGLPAGFFTALVVVKHEPIQAAWTGLASAFSPEVSRAGLTLLFLLLSAAFYLMIAVLFITRLKPRATARGFGPAALAVAGTIGAGPLALMPTQNDIATALIADFVMVVGMVGSILALTSLGRHFGIRPSARGVVTQGLYARVRHPLYLFEMLVQLGTLLMVLSPLAVAIFAAYVALQYGRTVHEERILAANFPEYRAYQVRTARFVPGLI